MDQSFVERVRHFQQDWRDRREYAELAELVEPHRTERLLCVLHAWASEAAADIHEVYGSTLELTVGPVEPDFRHGAGFTVAVAGSFYLDFEAGGNSASPTSPRTVNAGVRFGDGSREIALTRQSRHVMWNREQVQDLVMRLLGAYERSRDARLPRLQSR